MVTRVTNVWRAVELLGLLEECDVNIEALPADTPEWEKLIILRGELYTLLLRLVAGREPTTDEVESLTRGDFHEDFTRLLAARKSGQPVQRVIDELIKEWD